MLGGPDHSDHALFVREPSIPVRPRHKKTVARYPLLPVAFIQKPDQESVRSFRPLFNDLDAFNRALRGSRSAAISPDLSDLHTTI